MTTSLLHDKGKQPDDAALSAVLGKAKRHWDAILEHVDVSYPDCGREWKFYGAKHGWQLKIVQKKRAVLYLIPRPGSFGAAMALRPSAFAALRASGLPAQLVQEVEAAKPSSEGSPARIEVRNAADRALVEKLLTIKLAA